DVRHMRFDTNFFDAAVSTLALDVIPRWHSRLPPSHGEQLADALTGASANNRKDRLMTVSS
ncbi:hypothetical protein ACC735_39850, partial [Rhizobium ruizarguesonis]